MTFFQRKFFWRAASAAPFLLAGVSAAWAQTAAADKWPSKPIPLIIAFTAGGPIEVVGRQRGQKLGEALGVPIVYDNRAGANGLIGIDAVAKAPADGYTMFIKLKALMALAQSKPATGIKDGRVRASAISGTQRAPILPDVPTYAEIGLKGRAQVDGWGGLGFSVGTSQEKIGRIQQTMPKGMQKPDLKAQLDRLGLITLGTTQAEFSKFVLDDMAFQAKLFKAVFI